MKGHPRSHPDGTPPGAKRHRGAGGQVRPWSDASRSASLTGWRGADSAAL